MCGVAQLTKLHCVWGYEVNWIMELGPVRSVAASPGLVLLRETLATLSITHLGHQQLHEGGGKRKLLHHAAQVWLKR